MDDYAPKCSHVTDDSNPCGLTMRRIRLIIGWGWECPRGHWRTA